MSEPTGAGGMQQLCVRLTDSMFARLDVLAAERRVTRTRAVRQLLEAGLRDDGAVPAGDPPGEVELLAILAERARAGNVAAARTLLLRVEQRDPVDRWLAELLDD